MTATPPRCETVGCKNLPARSRYGSGWFRTCRECDEDILGLQIQGKLPWCSADGCEKLPGRRGDGTPYNCCWNHNQEHTVVHRKCDRCGARCWTGRPFARECRPCYQLAKANKTQSGISASELEALGISVASLVATASESV